VRPSILAELIIQITEPTIGLYVHIPFCSVKCFYCDFAAFSGQKKTTHRYLAALEAEARLMPERIPTTLYIGGGTPSELDASEIHRLFSLIQRAYPTPFSEVTFRGEPREPERGKLKVLADSGVTRLSLGLQTADADLLKSIGDVIRRDFSGLWAGQGHEGLRLAVDLMYGCPPDAGDLSFQPRPGAGSGAEHLSSTACRSRTARSSPRRAVETGRRPRPRDVRASLEHIKDQGSFIMRF